jgi:tetratricopeptide (TPR) repeat protein
MQLVVALDDWAYARRRVDGDLSCGPLLAAARLADPDPWRGRLRDALEGKESRTLEELVASAKSHDLPPTTAVLLARLSVGTSAAGRTLDVLRQVRQRYPGDFWINHELAAFLSRGGPAHLEEALRYHTVAAALRPESFLAHLNLGDALAKKGLLDEAIAEFREAIRLQKDDTNTHNSQPLNGFGPLGNMIPVEIEGGNTDAQATPSEHNR